MGCGKSKSLPPSDHPVDDEESNLGGVEKDTELTVRVDNAATPEPQGPLEQASDGVIAAALRQKRKANVVIFGESALGADIPSAKKSVPKSDAVRELITQALHDNVFFAEFGGAELRDLVDAMEPKSEAAGTVVIKQGDPGDNFYVIESGKFEIIVGERKVADWGEGTRNRTFGELALLYNLPRAATVRAVSDSQLWFIDRPTFRSIIARASQAQNERLRSALRRGILEDLTDAQLEALTGAATIVKYKQGDAIVRRGEAGEVFFIIEAGSVICKNLSGDQSNNILTAGDYFGERVLLRREARAADVEALTDVSLIALHREDFETHLGHLRDLLEYNIGMRLLLCTPLIGALSEEARNDMFGCLSVASYADGAVIAAQGRRCDSFFMVKDSSVAVRQLVMAPAGAASASPRLRLSTASRDTLSASGVAVSPPPSGRGPSGSASGSGGGFLTRSFSRANVASTGAATGTSSPQATPRPEAAGAAAAVPPSELKLAAPGGSGSNNTSRADTGGQAAAGAGSGGGQVTVTQELGLLHPGHWFPDRELDADAPLPASFVARGETQVFVLEREAYLRLVAPVKQRLLADGRLRSSTSAYYGTSAGGPAGASAAAGGGPGTPSGAGSPRVSSGGTGPARIASARAPSVSVAGSGSPATTSRGGVAPAADGLPTVSPLARQASDRFAPSGTAAGAAGGKGVATSAAAPAASARGAGPTTDARTARPAGDASSSSQHREGTEERSGAAGASSGGSSSAAAGARTGAGAMPSSSPAGGALPASTARAAGAAPTATPGAAGAPVVPSRPKEARRFSSDFKPPPPGAAGAGAGGVVGAPVPTLPPATRKRLGIPLRELELKKTLGTGTFGRVRLALHRKTNQVFALKMLQKAQIAALKQQRNIMAERDILWRVDHPFIIKLYDTYKDRDRLYMLLELVQVRVRARVCACVCVCGWVLWAWVGIWVWVQVLNVFVLCVCVGVGRWVQVRGAGIRREGMTTRQLEHRLYWCGRFRSRVRCN